MKSWPLLIGFIAILAIVCSPVLAISKGDLISYYRTEPSSLFRSYNSDTPYQIIEEKSAQFTPKELPTPQPNVMPFPKWPDSRFLKPFSKPSIPSSPKSYSNTQICPPAVPTSPLYHIMAICSDPETGEHYAMGSDLHGNVYIVKPGCQCTWAEFK